MSLTAVITMADENRLDHVRRQREALVRHCGGSPAGLMGSAGVEHLLVWLGDPAGPDLDGLEGMRIVPLPDTAVWEAADSDAGESAPRIPLAVGRNEGAREARELGADLLVFLDADCIPGPELLRLYREASGEHPEALLAGPVTYLTEAETQCPLPEIWQTIHPHAARPAPAEGQIMVQDATSSRRSDYSLFWSLSFALTPGAFERIGGFHAGYSGYGGEDTDFAFCAHKAGVDLAWVGGAHAFHQYHQVSSPPVEHVDDILANARVFRARWGVWPMLGWLEAFEERGLVRRDEALGWVRSSLCKLT